MSRERGIRLQNDFRLERRSRSRADNLGVVVASQQLSERIRTAHGNDENNQEKHCATSLNHGMASHDRVSFCSFDVPTSHREKISRFRYCIPLKKVCQDTCCGISATVEIIPTFWYHREVRCLWYDRNDAAWNA